MPKGYFSLIWAFICAYIRNICCLQGSWKLSLQKNEKTRCASINGHTTSLIFLYWVFWHTLFSSLSTMAQPRLLVPVSMPRIRAIMSYNDVFLVIFGKNTENCLFEQIICYIFAAENKIPTSYHNKAVMPKGKTYTPASVGVFFVFSPLDFTNPP